MPYQEISFNTFGYLFTGMITGIIPLILNDLENLNMYIKLIGSSAATLSALVALGLAFWNLNEMLKKYRCKKKNKNK